MSREALVLLVCCCDFRDGAEWLIPSKSLRNAVIRAFPGLFRILRMCAPRRAAAVVRPRGREKSADRRRRILISRLLIIRASVPRWKSPFPAYFKGFPAVSPLIPPYPAFLKYPVSPQSRPTVYRPSQRPSFRLRMFPSPFARLFGIKSTPFANEQYRNQEGKATRKRNSYQKVIICLAVTSALSLSMATQFLRCRGGTLFWFQRCNF